ncbi:hypothetical protein [Weissella hellenica]|uniref:Uncharacterized protein n=1 Tax=Weissella hellenica TaxID=46256 RepID=A0A4Y4G634_WEIHE|nr:hypothetical protein [Weissella hellenica]NKY66562.1 hypothetical protein [Weissella hellenica]GED35260.1 hypothetical protein WHE01_01640 [Weissella hellenica]SCB82196.1 hypothetical protein GA0061075_10361 [Weissella hellenica]
MVHNFKQKNKLVALIMFLGMLITILGIFLDSFSMLVIMLGIAIILFSEEISKLVEKLLNMPR